MLNYKKPRFWVIAVSMITVIVLGMTLVTNPKQQNGIEPEDTIAQSDLSTPETAHKTEYNKVEINYRSDTMGFKSARKFQKKDSKLFCI